MATTVFTPSLNDRKKCQCGNISVCQCGGCAIHCKHPEPPSIVSVMLAANIMQSSLNFKELPPHRGRSVNKDRTYERAHSPANEYTNYVFDHMDC